MTYDLVVVGGGPGGSSAAWHAAEAGARVCLLDKATFPRDKPCGDGLTPRAVALLESMGLEPVLERFHRVDTIRIVGPGWSVDRPWLARKFGLPDHGFVAARTQLDNALIEHAGAAGVDVRPGHEVLGPVTEGERVVGVKVRREGKTDEVRAPITVAADGMSSRMVRGSRMRVRSSPFGIAMRAQVESQRPDDTALEMHMGIRGEGRPIPGYGWVFPMGDQMVNIGVGFVSTFKGWKNVRLSDVAHSFIAGLPAEWRLPKPEDLLADGRLRGWRLPMGLCVWPPCQPGLLAVGDAAGVVKPFTGVGISKALESGKMAADCAVSALGEGSIDDLSAYADVVQERWGSHYRLGRAFVAGIGRPTVMRGFEWGMRRGPFTEFSLRLMSNLYRRRGGGVNDHLIRGLHRVADREEAEGERRVRRISVEARKPSEGAS